MFEGFDRGTRDINGSRINFVSRGEGPAILLLHGYPQSLVMWHKVAPMLAGQFTIVAPDIKGYGESSKPRAENDHNVYSNRTLAQEMVALMDDLGIDRFHTVGHDRGVRVAHRMALDHPGRVRSLTSLDVMPTQAAFEGMDASLAFAFFHWHLMRQPYPLPETLIGNSAEFYLDFLMERWCATPGAITPEAYAIYKEQFCRPETIHSTCSEYRAVELDLQHDAADRGRKLDCPVLALWGSDTRKRPGWQTGKGMSFLDAWRERADRVEGRGIACGHFIPEEAPDEVVAELKAFYATVAD